MKSTTLIATVSITYQAIISLYNTLRSLDIIEYELFNENAWKTFQFFHFVSYIGLAIFFLKLYIKQIKIKTNAK